MSEERVDLVEILRAARRSAGDMRKVLLSLYGLLLTVPLALLVVAAGRSMLFEGFGAEIATTFERPVHAAGAFFRAAFEDGRWALMVSVLLGIWFCAVAVGSFFGLAITRMAAIELTCERRAEVKESVAFARGHWHWALFTPAGLVLGALVVFGLAVGVVSLANLSSWFLVIGAPVAFGLVLAAVVLVLGQLGGGLLAWPAIATEWSDAFDAITRVYGYSFAHVHRVFFYRVGIWLTMLGATLSRGIRAALVVGIFSAVLVAGLGTDRTMELFNSVLLEPPEGLPFPQTLAGWALLACATVYLTLVVARLMVFALVLRQAVYLVLRFRVDKVPLDNIDGYRPDDSNYDPTAQGFELVEVEEEIRA